ncbi:serine/threonine-protein kinase [Nocardia alba]|uniref:non-specific serine/threonine protein kinase n=1 Tax=Nocardia alba TaxID=225051 RepID=A0A4R1G7D9_9NOCA|nr:serine/threonine-protein kinase [Nocardia alba]TCJ99811.1 serine/threonine protein kinase [Nocardia alba]
MHGVEFGAGTVFAGYRIDRLLGRGGMGTVYLAAHPRLPRQVALKLLGRELSSDDEVRGRFEREADVSAHLDHPGIVSVLDRGVEDGLMWISMQYVDGRDASVFRGEPLDPSRAIGIIAQTAEALDYAHDRGVLHRDVKPANILLAASRTGDRVLLTDFGIARLLGDARQLTRTGAFLATLAYASPEQLSGAPVDHRSDQYSLGCTLFTLLTGESPFPADNPGAVVAAHLTKPVPSASAVVAALPPGIDAVIARAMAKAPDERFDSCEEFARAATAASVSAGSVSRGTGGSRSPRAGEPARVVGGAAVPVGVASGREHLPTHSGESLLDPTQVSSPSYAVARQAPVGGGRTEAIGAVAVPHPGYAHVGAREVGQRAPSGGRSGRPPQRAVSSRWRVLAVSLIVLALVAGVGIIGVAGIYWKFVRPNRIPPPPTWGAHGSVASGFTDLIPSGPTGRGWRGANCSATPSLVVLPGDPAPLRQIMCTDADGVIAWYTEYPDATDVDAYLRRHTTEDLTRELHHTSLVAYRPRDPAAPFTLATRERGNVFSANSVVEVSWPGHTFEETRDNWWQLAPF